MIIETRVDEKKKVWIAYVWDEGVGDTDFNFNTSTEDVYVELNDWCNENLHYNARTAYNVFEFKTEQDINWFMLRWL